MVFKKLSVLGCVRYLIGDLMKGADFLKLIKSRENCFEFSEKRVPESVLHNILEAARWAPSYLNIQPWSFIIVRGRKKILELMHYCHYGFFHSDPNVIVAVVLELPSKEFKGLLKGKIKEVTSYHQLLSISLPAFTMLLSAQAFGISSCILSPVVKSANKTLRVPEGKKAILLVGLGFEKKSAFKKPRARKPLKDLVFLESYGARK